MSTLKLSSLLPDVQPEVPNCPRALILHRLRKAAIDFCGETRIWNEVLSAFNIYAGIGDYDVPAPVGADVLAVRSVSFNGSTIPNTTAAALDNSDPAWRDRTDAKPSQYLSLLPGRIYLYPKPTADVDDAVTVYAALLPKADATELPEWLVTQWRQALVAFALWELLSMSKQPWYDPREAEKNRLIYRSKIGPARVSAATGGSDTPMRTRGYHI